MTNQTTKTVAIVLSTLGILFMVSIGFGLLPWNLAVFAGVACFIVAGMVKKLGGQEE